MKRCRHRLILGVEKYDKKFDTIGTVGQCANCKKEMVLDWRPVREPNNKKKKR